MAIKRTGVRFPGRTALWVEGFRLRYRLTVDPLRSAATARDARMRTRVRIGYSRASLRAISSAGERFVHTEEVTGSIPVSPTAVVSARTARLSWSLGRAGPWRGQPFIVAGQWQFEGGADGVVGDDDDLVDECFDLDQPSPPLTPADQAKIRDHIHAVRLGKHNRAANGNTVLQPT